MSREFIHLHTHSEFSLLDGLGRLGDILDAAAGFNMPSIALTDHGAMFGAIDFYSKAKERGIKPIIGCEVYVSDRPLDERAGPDARNYHLVLLAENEVGYRNLIRLTTEAHIRGFYRKPRVDHGLLEAHSDGLICLSGCASSELSRFLVDNNMGEAEKLADWYRQVFPGRYYLELQYHDLDFQSTINSGLVHLSRTMGLPLVATNDVHYVERRHAHTHEVLLCIQTQTTMDDPKRMRMSTEEFYMKSPDEMHALFADYPEALSNTLEIAERCCLDLTFGRPQLPRFQTPEGQPSEEYLQTLSVNGMVQRYGTPSDEVRSRLEYELSVIVSTGFVDYLLLVYDVIHFARTHGIGVGPGRGSAAGSLVSYCLYLTNVDPIGHGLSFERFLNPERITMPDMDLDFADDRRDEVIKYVTEKYGRDRVAQIITFGTIGPRAGVRDVGRAQSLPYADVDRVAKLIPPMCSKVSKAKADVPELQHLYDNNSTIKKLLDTVEGLEGVSRHASTHAAGVVIARDPLADHVPLYKVPKNDQVVTQYSMSAIEKIGLLKLDLLGLRTLTILARAAQFVEQSTGSPLDLDDIPLEHPSIYELLSSGETFGVFQVDGQGMKRFLRDLKPSEFNHVVAMLAMYRPGPMDYIGKFAARKNGVEAVSYDHPALEQVLEETYGIVVYQEQVMRLANVVAGYSMGEGDLLRRAMAKKKPEELAKHRTTFIERAQARGTERSTAEHLFDIIEPFSGYAFNKSHSAAYALITCQTAYLKANYPREYMAGLLSAEKDNADRVADAMAECRRLGISILPPDVNRSHPDFVLEDGGIRFGLTAIKHVGSAAIESILVTRAVGGEFHSLEEFCSRVDWSTVNKRVVESLARCGAFDSLGVERNRLVESVDRVVGFGAQLYRAASGNQQSLFGESDAPAPVLQLAPADSATIEQKVGWEQELLGIAVSRHPVVDAEDRIREARAQTVSDAQGSAQTGRVSVGGLIKSLRTFSTKDGRPMATLQLTDLQATLDVVVFSRSFEQYQPVLLDGTIVVIDGKMDASDGSNRIVVDAVHPLVAAKDRALLSHANGNGSGNGNGNGNGRKKSNGNGHQSEEAGPTVISGPSRRITIAVDRGEDREVDLNTLLQAYALLQKYRGNDEVDLFVQRGVERHRVTLPQRFTGVCEQLVSDLKRVLPGAVVEVGSLTSSVQPDVSPSGIPPAP